MSIHTYPIFVSCPKDLEYLLAEELGALGLVIEKTVPQGVHLETDLAGIYHICLWSRIANRVHLLVLSGEAYDGNMLYTLCKGFHWHTLFSADKTLAIQCHGTSKKIDNAMYGAQVIKDAIADHFREFAGTRPNVDKKNPDILIHALLKQDTISISLDLAGFSLHQRGYRERATIAPIKENLAASLLYRMQWPTRAQAGDAFYDPCCGSGTLVIEAALMAAHIAPGLLRDDHHFVHWRGYNADLWHTARKTALAQVRPVSNRIEGSDRDAQAIRIAETNAKRAGVHALVHFTMHDITNIAITPPRGLLLANPPYGERLEDTKTLIPWYQTLGHMLSTQCQGWEAGILTANPMLAKAIGLRAHKQFSLHNGPIACKLYCFHINSSNKLKHQREDATFSAHAQMFANRLAKNAQHRAKWAKRQGITAYRIYDADLPEYACAIDLYAGYVVLYLYRAPASIPEHVAENRALEMIQVIYQVLACPPDHLIIKERQRQKGSQQYEKQAAKPLTFMIQEGEVQFKVNLSQYLDTGVFLDHRPLRLQFAKLPPKTKFLNCYCYTATASVHAARAGACTTNIDLSKTYLAWAEDNFRANHLPLAQHRFIHADVEKWLTSTRERFDVIFLDPPSFSNSKRMTGVLDIQRDHPRLIALAMRCLTPEGRLYFSTNLRSFQLSSAVENTCVIEDISRQTIDEDFKRTPRIHRCFILRNK